MWERAKWFAMPLLVFCCFCFSPELGSCSEAVEGKITEVMSVSKEDWMRLKVNNDAQKRALNESEEALREAKEALSASRVALEESERELEALRKEYEQQKAELMMLKEELRTQKSESATASDALTKANKFLADTKTEIEAREAAWRKREAQLERQRILWQIAAVVLGGVAIAT